MRLCQNCKVRIEEIECADGHDRWMHKVVSDVHGMSPTMYLECKMPVLVATP